MELQQYCVTENIQSDQASPLTNVNTYWEVKVAGPLNLVFDDDDNQLAIGDPNTPTAELNMPSDSQVDPAPCETIVVEGLDSGTVVGIAFAAFIIGVLLTGALWYIHTHTGKKGPMAVRGNRPRSAETSGESTPSSTAPITIHQINHH